MAVDYFRLIEIATYAAYCRCLVGGIESASIWSKWFRDYHVGDLVLEVSTIGDESRNGRLGRLTSIKKEFVAYTEGGGGYEDTFYYLELPDGTETKWNNAGFIRVIENYDTFRTLEFPKL